MADAMEFRLEGIEELRKAFQKAKDRAHVALASGLFLEAERIMRDSKRQVPVDEGILRASGFVRPPTTSGTKIVVTMGYGGAAKAYALYIHEGTGPAVGRPPFMPPVAPIREWARRVLGDASLGFVIARAIGQKGLRPRKYLEKPFRRRVRGMGRRLATHVRKEVERG